jgi:hypothetical protein
VYFGDGSVDAKGRLRTILLAINRALFYRAAQHSLASILQQSLILTIPSSHHGTCSCAENEAKN